MKNLRNIAVLFLAFWMMLSSGGFALFSHHCACSGEAHTSMLFEQTCAHQHPGPDNAGSCCALPEQDTGHHCPSLDGEACCESNALLFLKTSDFTTATAKEVKTPVRLLPATRVAEIVLPLAEEQATEYELPPPLLSLHLRKHILLFSGAFHSALS